MMHFSNAPYPQYLWILEPKTPKIVKTFSFSSTLYATPNPKFEITKTALVTMFKGSNSS